MTLLSRFLIPAAALLLVAAPLLTPVGRVELIVGGLPLAFGLILWGFDGGASFKRPVDLRVAMACGFWGGTAGGIHGEVAGSLLCGLGHGLLGLALGQAIQRRMPPARRRSTAGRSTRREP